jgi:hypothetical protein
VITAVIDTNILASGFIRNKPDSLTRNSILLNNPLYYRLLFLYARTRKSSIIYPKINQ